MSEMAEGLILGVINGVVKFLSKTNSLGSMPSAMSKILQFKMLLRKIGSLIIGDS
jgi:hypothetical protein